MTVFKDTALLAAALGMDCEQQGWRRWRGKGVVLCLYYKQCSVDLVYLLKDGSWGTRKKVGVCMRYFFFFSFLTFVLR